MAMKQLIAKRSILYQNRIYAPARPCPPPMAGWPPPGCGAGSAAWQEGHAPG